MKIREAIIGFNKGPLELTLESSILLTRNLLKMQFSDSDHTRVSSMVSGQNIIKFFNDLPLKCKIILNTFLTCNEYSMIRQYFPDFLNCENIVKKDSDVSFFLLFTEPLPHFVVQYQDKSLEIQPNLDLKTIDIKQLLQAAPRALPQEIPLRYYSDLKTIKEKIVNNTILDSCCVCLIDCCDSYQPKPDSKDLLAIYKITDQSIYPATAIVNIFHKFPQDLQKIANFGDIIVFYDIQFREFNGVVQGIIPANSKQMSFHVFNCKENTTVPYINYKCGGNIEPECASTVKNAKDWLSSTFQKEVPGFFIEKNRKIKEIISDAEMDLLGKVLGICYSGLIDKDPLILILGDDEDLCKVVIPNERARLLRWVKIGDSIRIRSVFYGNGYIYLSNYSEILVLPFDAFQVPDYIYKSKLKSYINFYSNTSTEFITAIQEKCEKFDLVSFDRIKDYPKLSVVRIQGYPLYARYKNGIVITLWDGEDENNVIDVIIKENKIKSFLNGKSIDTAKESLVSDTKLFNAAIEINESEYQVVHTSII